MSLEWNDRRAFDLYRLLGQLLNKYSHLLNKHEMADLMIEVCIDNGATTRALIVRSIKAHGFKPRHIAMRVNGGTGADPSRFRWWLDNKDQYRLHAQSKA